MNDDDPVANDPVVVPSSAAIVKSVRTGGVIPKLITPNFIACGVVVSPRNRRNRPSGLIPYPVYGVPARLKVFVIASVVGSISAISRYPSWRL